VRNRDPGGRTGLEDDIYDAVIGEGFRATIDRPEPNSVVRSWGEKTQRREEWKKGRGG